MGLYLAGLYLAIDAGGTKTRCALADETRVLARAETGTVKLMRVAEAEATARLHAMLAEAATSAGVSLSEVRRTCFGLAGSRSERVQEWARRTMGDAVGGELVVCGDEEIALEAAFEGGAGILVIAGTGSNAIGRAEDGALFGAGGWGPVLGDEGSGYWIGLEAVRAALRVQDEGDESGAAASLLRDIERALGCVSLGGLIALGNLRAPSETMTPPDFAALAPVVTGLAEQGNEIAAGVLRDAGRALAKLVESVARKMAAGGPGQVARGVRVAYAGSVLREIAAVREAFLAAVAEARPGAVVRDEVIDPLEGALWRARRG